MAAPSTRNIVPLLPIPTGWRQRGTGTSAAQGTNASSLVVDKPNSITPGDLLVIICGSVNAGRTFSCTGFQTLFTAGGTGMAMQGLYRIADGTEGSTFTVNQAGGNSAMALACGAYYHSAGYGRIVLDTQNAADTASGTQHTSPSVTPAATGELAIGGFAVDDDTSANPWAPVTSGYLETSEGSVANSPSVELTWATGGSGAQTTRSDCTTAKAGRVGLAFFQFYPAGGSAIPVASPPRRPPLNTGSVVPSRAILEEVAVEALPPGLQEDTLRLVRRRYGITDISGSFLALSETPPPESLPDGRELYPDRFPPRRVWQPQVDPTWLPILEYPPGSSSLPSTTRRVPGLPHLKPVPDAASIVLSALPPGLSAQPDRMPPARRNTGALGFALNFPIYLPEQVPIGQLLIAQPRPLVRPRIDLVLPSGLTIPLTEAVETFFPQPMLGMPVRRVARIPQDFTRGLTANEIVGLVQPPPHEVDWMPPRPRRRMRGGETHGFTVAEIVGLIQPPLYEIGWMPPKGRRGIRVGEARSFTAAELFALNVPPPYAIEWMPPRGRRSLHWGFTYSALVEVLEAHIFHPPWPMGWQSEGNAAGQQRGPTGQSSGIDAGPSGSARNINLPTGQSSTSDVKPQGRSSINRPPKGRSSRN